MRWRGGRSRGGFGGGVGGRRRWVYVNACKWKYSNGIVRMNQSFVRVNDHRRCGVRDGCEGAGGEGG